MLSPIARSICIFALVSYAQAAYRGIFTADCQTAPEACENACFYMYCANPSPQGRQHIFYDNGKDRDKTYNKRNRIQSGVTVSGPVPCRALPLTQKFYDTVLGWSGLDLQTDEFPLAAWKQDTDFTPEPWPPRNTLRCIPHTQNSDFGNQWKNFRHASGPWGHGDLEDPTRSSQRLGSSNPFARGDSFNVDFMNVSPRSRYCNANRDCSPETPPREFHMVQKRGTSNGPNDRGIIHQPYDFQTDNTYQITNVQTRNSNYLPIKSFRMVIRREIANNQDHIWATRQIYSRQTRNWETVTQQDDLGTGQPGEVQTVPGATDPSGLYYDEVDVERQDGSFSGVLNIKYGNQNGPNSEKVFPFTTSTKGYNGDYCSGATVKDDQGRDLPSTYEYTCDFPGI